MSRWSLGRKGSSGRRGAAPSGRGTDAAGPGGPRPGPGPAFAVEEYDGLVLLRLPSDETLGPADVDDLVRAFASDDDYTVTVVAGADEASAAAMWPRLGTLLDSLREEDITTVRLVMSGAGEDGPDRRAVARRIADAWGFEVIAPDGVVLVVPGGGLFVPGRRTDSGAERGWWSFSAGADPVPLGPRQPAPAWQPPAGSLPAKTRNGCVVEQIPAGLLIRPEEAIAPRPGDLCYAIPVDRRGPTVLVGVADGEDVLAADVVEAVTALPEPARTHVRIAPGGRRDVLSTGQAVADALESDVVVHTGLPLLSGGSHGGLTGRNTVRATFADADGVPRWHPYVDAVECLPAKGTDGPAPSPRLLRWSPPVPGRGNTEHGVVRLSDRWQVTVTRAGLWVSGRDGRRLSPTARPVSADGPVIEIGRPGEPLDLSLWPELSRLLVGLGADVCARARLHVHGTAVDGGRELRRLAGHHQLRSIRFGTRPAPAAGEARVPAAARPPVPAPGEARVPAAARPPVPVVPAAAEAAAPPAPGRAVRPSLMSTAPAANGPHRQSEPGPPGPAVASATAGNVQPARTEPTARKTPPEKKSPAAKSPAAKPERRPVEPPKPVAAEQGRTEPEPSVPAAPPRVPDASPPRVPDPAPARVPDPAPARRPEPSRVSTTASGPAPVPARAAAPAPVTALPPVPFHPGHSSTEAERTAFRALADTVWERHGAAVVRTLTRMPALRGQEQEAARADLIALQLYLRTAEGPLSHDALNTALRSGDERLLPYAACVASGLRRLPSFRGTVLRGATAAVGTGGLSPGSVLRDPGPVSALPLGSDGPVPGGARCAIWSVTGRRVRSLFDAAGSAEPRDEVVFPPGTAFRILDLRTDGGSPLVLLRELPAGPPDAPFRQGPPDDQDLAVLARLDESLSRRPAAAGPYHWPDRCSGPVGPNGN
ncbi:hypothetical protein ABZ707_12930 [Streptomyces sp. NPDC006923]|uniref:hypothetical protein n=1 Tax=Streptomyces sp. NPDC006923 TaxID=3155355 RepID=UPI0033E3FBAA